MQPSRGKAIDDVALDRLLGVETGIVVEQGARAAHRVAGRDSPDWTLAIAHSAISVNVPPIHRRAAKSPTRVAISSSLTPASDGSRIRSSRGTTPPGNSNHPVKTSVTRYYQNKLVHVKQLGPDLSVSCNSCSVDIV
jgi:hypothetical protein